MKVLCIVKSCKFNLGNRCLAAKIEVVDEIVHMKANLELVHKPVCKRYLEVINATIVPKIKRPGLVIGD